MSAYGFGSTGGASGTGAGVGVTGFSITIGNGAGAGSTIGGVAGTTSGGATICADSTGSGATFFVVAGAGLVATLALALAGTAAGSVPVRTAKSQNSKKSKFHDYLLQKRAL